MGRRMSGMDSWAMVEASRASITARVSTLQKRPIFSRSAFESGCSDYITKPFNANELLNKLERYLGE